MLISSQHLLITVWNVTSADKAPDTIHRLLANGSRKFPLKRLLRPLSYSDRVLYFFLLVVFRSFICFEANFLESWLLGKITLKFAWSH